MPLTDNRKLLDEVRDVIRWHHYSIHTERTYSEWLKKCVRLHAMDSREDPKNSEKKIAVLNRLLA